MSFVNDNIPSNVNDSFDGILNSTFPSNETSILKSVYIPRVYANLTSDFVAEIFESLNLGVVDRVEAVTRPGDKTTYMAFVYFASWNTDNKAAVHLAERINTYDGGRPARIVYDDPWYWILLPNKSQKQFININKYADIEQRIDVLLKTIEDLQTRIKVIDEKNQENEKKINNFGNELNDINAIIFYADEVKNDTHCYHPKLYRQTAGYWPELTVNNTVNYSNNCQADSTELISASVFENMHDMPISHPKLYRQTAISYPNEDIIPDVENGMMKHHNPLPANPNTR
jgi:hypothetical protein